jgi:ATP-binding cassette subfamily F protein 3
MLQIRNLTYKIAGITIVENISWTIDSGKKLALIGPNGAGKTTLLRILNDDLEAVSGDIIKPKQYVIGYLPQEEVYVGKGSLLAAVLEVHSELIEIESEIHDIRNRIDSSENQTILLQRLGELEHQYDIRGGYRIEAEAKKVLMGLGFSENDFNRPLSELSGGWQMRAYLARLLLQNPDLLLLDEPTNHLDIQSLEWLESYLMSFRGSIIFVSHDRFFIDRLAQEIAELEFQKLIHYPGNYHYYEQQKELNRQQLLQKVEEQRQERERITRFIERFRYKNTKATQVQSRVKMLEKMEVIEIPPEQKDFRFKIKAPVKSYKDVCRLQDVSFRYDISWVLRDLNLNLYRGEKVALVGVNGAGKTTMTRIMTEELRPDMGKIEIGERVSIGYYAQHQIDSLNLDNKVVDEVSASADPVLRTHIRDILGIFQFSGDEIEKPISVLSGGEKARVSLAKILVSPVNFLIMDEPTNHLDLYSKQALERALKEYDGTLLLISHDRYFLDKLVNRVFELRDGSLRIFEGNYSDYLRKRESDKAGSVKKLNLSKDSQRASRKEQKRIEAEARQEISALRNELNDRVLHYETLINKLEEEKLHIEKMMADPDFYKDKTETAKSGKRYQELQGEIPEAMAEWESASLKLDEILTDLQSQS